MSAMSLKPPSKRRGQSFPSHTASMSKPSIWNRTRRWQFLRYVRGSFRAGVCEGGGYCEWGEIDRGTDYAGARSEYRVKLKNVDIAERLYYFTKTII